MQKSFRFIVTVLLVLYWCSTVYSEDLNIYMARGDVVDQEADDGESKMAGVFIKEIVIEGNTVIDSDTLNKITEPYKNRELTLEEMSELTDLITVTYQEKGFILARAYLPEQEIQDGILKISIAEGKIGKIKVSGYTHYKPDVIKRYFEQQQKQGVVQESLLEKGLLLSSDIPNVKTTVVLKEGEKPGEVDVILDTKDTQKVTFGVDMRADYNNFGSDIVGEDRYGTSIGITDHVFGSVLNLRGVTGNTLADSGLLNIDWTLPINSYGTKFNLNYLHGNYAVGQELADLGMTGRTQIYGASLYHPIIKKKNMNFGFNLGYAYKYNKNIILRQERSIDELDLYYVGFNFDSLDRFLGKNIFSLGYSWGQLKLDEKLETSRIEPDTSFDKYNLSFARIQKIYGYTNIMLRGGLQYSDKRLVPIEMMGLGGYGTVRGYDPSLFLGDSGFNVSAELMFAPPFIAEKLVFGQRLAQLVQFALFYDHGGVYVTDATSDESTQFLSGYGAGIRLFYKDWFTFKYDIGFPKESIEGKPNKFNYFQLMLNLF